MAKAKTDPLNSATINIPVGRSFKRRVVTLAGRFPGKPKPTVYARLLLEDAVKRAEHGQHPGEVEMASSTK